ncbi:MAG: cytochrome c oxidase subunit II [Candidatus Magnetoovum sp. WYHC-5]|nr:cytochrome c oxidase subunit II [Candidatus Magnetoovum sp. WYHC-5]
MIFVIVFVPLLYFVFKYRRTSENHTGAYIEGNTGLEIMWTAIPVVIIVLLGVQTWALFNEYRSVPANAHEVKVEAYQYGFKMVSPEGIETDGEFTVPAGPVKLNMTSRDVIHDFAVPAFRVREDTVPGRWTYMWFNASKEGTYQVYCAELCGPGHSLMLAKLNVVSKAQYAKWVEENKMKAQTMTPVERGEKLAKQCIGCHSLDGSPAAGPTLKGLFNSDTKLADGSVVKTDVAFLKKKIKAPKNNLVDGYPPMMPPYSFTDDELNAVVEYIKSLK